MCRVLWVEDEADGQLADYVDPVIAAGYDLDIELNASDAIEKMRKHAYQLVIMDLIIAAGNDLKWKEYDNLHHGKKVKGYLGLQLLKAILDESDSDRKLHVTLPGNWLKPERVAVFTVISDVDAMNELGRIGVANVTEKAQAPITELRRIIDAKCWRAG